MRLSHALFGDKDSTRGSRAETDRTQAKDEFAVERLAVRRLDFVVVLCYCVEGALLAPCRNQGWDGFVGAVFGKSVCSDPFRRLAAWLGVLAVVVQILMPLSQPLAAVLSSDGLFPSACSSHDSDAPPADDSTGAKGGHCQFCPVHVGDRLLPLSRSAVPAFAPAVEIILPAGIDDWRLPSSRASPAAPPRGPPSAV